MSGHCVEKPTFAVFSKHFDEGKMAIKAYFGGYEVEITENAQVKIDGTPKNIENMKAYIHEKNGVEIFRIIRSKDTFAVMSLMGMFNTGMYKNLKFDILHIGIKSYSIIFSKLYIRKST